MSEPLTITDAAPLIKSGELTPSELLEQCLRRVDQYEHAVRAWVYLDRERARLEAATFTEEIKNGQYRGPLHGIPIGIKDIIDVYDMPTGCGSKLWANSYARKDATCVARLRQAGAVIMGKTVTTPYAYLDPPVTRNPWNLERTPGGSSSGSAAAVACAMCLGALGTQTGGSLTRPAAYCGVCSLKPSYGRVSVEGVLPLASSLDHVGVMARCVHDLAILFGAISIRPVSMRNDFDDGLSGSCRFSLLRGSFEEKTSVVMTSAINRWKVKSYQFEMWMDVEDRIPRTGFEDVYHWHRILMSAQAAVVHGERQSRVPEDYPPNITKLIEFGRTVSAADSERAHFERDMADEDYTHGIVSENRVWMTPATTGEAPSAESTGDPTFNSPWSFAGCPTVSVPIEFSPEGLPLAIQFISAPNRDEELFPSARVCELAAQFPSELPPITPIN